jgi:hypothetical protein
MTRYIVTDDNLKIIDSYKLSKKYFSAEIKSIRDIYPDSKVWNRGIPQMCLELACHNFAYNVGFQRERTKDTDINYPQSFWERALYAVVGVLVWVFVP